MSLSEKPERIGWVSDETPECVRVTNHSTDVWYTYKGELLFEPEVIEKLEKRYEEMEATNYDQPERTKLKIRTEDREDCKADLQDRVDEVHDEFGFVFEIDQLTGPYDGIRKEGPRKSVATVSYNQRRHAGLGGPDYKRDKLLLPVREYEQYVYHNRVWLPVVEKYNEKYPY